MRGLLCSAFNGRAILRGDTGKGGALQNRKYEVMEQANDPYFRVFNTRGTRFSFSDF